MHTYHHNEVSDLDLSSIVQSGYQLLLPFHRLLMQYLELVLCQNKRTVIENKHINTKYGHKYRTFSWSVDLVEK